LHANRRNALNVGLAFVVTSPTYSRLTNRRLTRSTVQFLFNIIHQLRSVKHNNSFRMQTNMLGILAICQPSLWVPATILDNMRPPAAGLSTSHARGGQEAIIDVSQTYRATLTSRPAARESLHDWPAGQVICRMPQGRFHVARYQSARPRHGRGF